MATKNFGRLNLLFVDDDALTRLLLREVLGNTYWRHAVIVDSAAAAFDAITAATPDLVFTDWQMPGGTGLDLIRAIHEHAKSPDPLLPVFLLTARGDVEHVRTGRDAGAAGFLVKPISLRSITERVIDVVNKPQPFIVSPGYIGPDRHRVDRPVSIERRSRDKLPPGTVVLPPDGLLLAKVLGEPAAIREAQRRRTDAIAIVRSFATIARMGGTSESGH